MSNDNSTWKERHGLSCHHIWDGYAWTRCPKCGDVSAEEVDFQNTQPTNSPVSGGTA